MPTRTCACTSRAPQAGEHVVCRRAFAVHEHDAAWAGISCACTRNAPHDGVQPPASAPASRDPAAAPRRPARRPARRSRSSRLPTAGPPPPPSHTARQAFNPQGCVVDIPEPRSPCGQDLGVCVCVCLVLVTKRSELKKKLRLSEIRQEKQNLKDHQIIYQKPHAM